MLDLEVQVMPGVSAMDCLFAELMVDPCVSGLQMYEATEMLLRRRPLQPDVPALIWQIGCVETTLHTMRRSKPERFERLQSHLLQFYPAEHTVTAFHSTPHPLARSTSLRFSLGEMCAQAHALHAGFTLFIPPAHARPIKDRELLDRMNDVKHLRRITH